MKRHFHFLILTYFFIIALAVPVWAKVYQIPSELLQEVKANKQAALANPSADTYFELAMSYAYTGQIEKGWNTLKKIPDYKKNYETTFAPGVVEKYEALAKQEPTNWKHPFKAAFGYYFQGKKDEAIRSFRRVLEISPNHVWALGFIALIHGERGEVEKGIEIAKQAIRIEPNAAALHALLMAGYAKTGNYWGALQETITVGKLRSEENSVYGKE
ncbi:hypothetical protein EBR96_01795 [bacterium]|nr:hypothetical protein [bacterium]